MGAVGGVPRTEPQLKGAVRLKAERTLIVGVVGVVVPVVVPVYFEPSAAYTVTRSSVDERIYAVFVPWS